jgi:hypothetical protein
MGFGRARAQSKITDSEVQPVSKTSAGILRIARFSHSLFFKNQHKHLDKGNHRHDLDCQVTISLLKSDPRRKKAQKGVKVKNLVSCSIDYRFCVSLLKHI